MYPARDHDSLPVLDCIRITLESGDDDHFAVVSRDRRRQSPPPQAVLPLRVQLQVRQVTHQVRVGVRVTVSQVDGVVIVIELHTEGQSVIVPRILPFHRILIVTDVTPTAEPTLPTSFCLLLGIDDRTHTMIIEGIWFHHVDDVESVGLASTCVTNPKIVPLSVTSSVIIRLQDQIVFEFINLDCTSEVSRFESGFKYQSIVVAGS